MRVSEGRGHKWPLPSRSILEQAKLGQLRIIPSLPKLPKLPNLSGNKKDIQGQKGQKEQKEQNGKIFTNYSLLITN